jgi:hypothetical protein
MISNTPVEIKESAISNVQLVHPLQGTASAGRRRPVQAVGRSRWLRPVGASTSQRSGLREPRIADCGLFSLLPPGMAVERPWHLDHRRPMALIA